MSLADLIEFLKRFATAPLSAQLKQIIEQLIDELVRLPPDQTVNEVFTRTNKDLMQSLAESKSQNCDADLELLKNAVTSWLEVFGPMMKSANKSAMQKFVGFLGLVAPAESNDNEKTSTKDRVSVFVSKLEESGTNRALFNKVIEEIQRLKSDLTIDELDAISKRYTTVTRKAKSKREAVERIERHFEVGAQHAARMAEISKIS